MSALLSPPSLLASLNQFYRRNGIHSLDFRCDWKEACRAAAGERFTGPKASLVGRQYELGVLPRILFLSLDSGKASQDPEDRTPEAVRAGEEQNPATGRHKGQHWYQTDEFALIVLSRFQPDLTIDDAGAYTARVNAAKCCANRKGNRKAPRILFGNCQQYLANELQLLDPAIIVTQANEAWEAMSLLSGVCLTNGDYGHVGVCAANEHPILWLHTYHPSCFGRYWPQRKACGDWELYADVVKNSFDGTSPHPIRIREAVATLISR
ncbi:MAG TPA: uracil-DNA glycosylase family protein [Bryobacteraceae bacterium]|jgi:hypothetical protein|nr:uracil-DNA glycosylase family protein [Bryobacteraceae bacterium]